ncbi:MAG: hypothetical protein PHU08_07240 [Dehalococcoidales bacterium]|nr:hypothetical protein [Dehalococcoidales bacterium]
MKLYLFNPSSGTWEVVAGSSVDTTATPPYIYATVTHLSQYGGFGSAVTAAPNPPGGGGGAPAPAPGINIFGVYVNSLGQFLVSVTAVSDDSLATLSIPQNTIGKDASGLPLDTITMMRVTTQPLPVTLPSGVIMPGYLYEMGPGGATFSPNVVLTIRYDPSLLPPGFNENNLKIGYWNPDTGEWVLLGGVNVNTAAHLASVPISHFTYYAVLAYTTLAPTPTPTPTATVTPTPTPAATPTPKPTASPTPTVTPPSSPTPTASVSPTASPAASPTPPVTSPVAPPPPPPSGTNIWLIIGIIVVVAAIVAGYLIWRRRRAI